MKNKWNIVGIVVAIIIAVAGWLINREKSTVLNIEKVNETRLTKSLEVDGLSSKYFFNDSLEVQNLWRATFVIRNVGRKTIFGEGFAGQSIKGGHIPFVVEDCDNVLSVIITNDNCGAQLTDALNLKVSQWRPQEYVEITVLTDGGNSPNIKISDRDIADSQITYSVYSPEQTNDNAKLIEYLPTGLANFLKWLIISCIVIFSLSNVFGIINQIKTQQSSQGVIVWTIIAMLVLQIGLLLPLLWIFP